MYKRLVQINNRKMTDYWKSKNIPKINNYNNPARKK